ncbi:MAG TPA: Holliday junction resolvase RuvX [Anaerolineae bacterium]|nr:MAG: hypothetical protein AMJ88_16005 [Anaerolineae bacterium SM23_ 63]HEY43967.1 Holliday junction resolvase RuvX [Anaerolineae bacterium]
MTRILAVDPGEVRIGLAISDPTGTIARPLSVLRHTARRKDALSILDTAVEHDVAKILVGIALDMEGEIGPQARRALRLVEALRIEGDLPVFTWDESGSTQSAQLGKGRDPMLDARAAAVFLQEYLDAQKD